MDSIKIVEGHEIAFNYLSLRRLVFHLTHLETLAESAHLSCDSQPPFWHYAHEICDAGVLADKARTAHHDRRDPDDPHRRCHYR